MRRENFKYLRCVVIPSRLWCPSPGFCSQSSTSAASPPLDISVCFQKQTEIFKSKKEREKKKLLPFYWERWFYYPDWFPSFDWWQRPRLRSMLDKPSRPESQWIAILPHRCRRSHVRTVTGDWRWSWPYRKSGRSPLFPTGWRIWASRRSTADTAAPSCSALAGESTAPIVVDGWMRKICIYSCLAKELVW